MDNPHIIDVLRSRERCPSKNNPLELFRRVLPCTERLVLWGFVLMGIDYHVYFEFARGKSAFNLNLGFATKNRGGFCRKNRSTAKNACICVQNDSKNTQRIRDDVVQCVEMVENGGGCLTA